MNRHAQQQARLTALVSAIVNKPDSSSIARKSCDSDVLSVKPIGLQPEDRIIVGQVFGLNRPRDREVIQTLKGAQILGNGKPISAALVGGHYAYDASAVRIHLQFPSKDEYDAATLCDLSLAM